jgi:hypothetical protein
MELFQTERKKEKAFGCKRSTRTEEKPKKCIHEVGQQLMSFNLQAGAVTASPRSMSMHARFGAMSIHGAWPLVE